MLGYGASHHLIFDATKVPNCSSYVSYEGITMRNGSQISISNIGLKVLQIRNECFLFVKNLLNTPYFASNLLSIQILCVNNNVLIEFCPDSFSVKHVIFKKTLL